jgi:ferrous iron transport protein A
MTPANRSLNPCVPLATLRKGQRGIVAAIREDAAAIMGEVPGATISRRLLELGFVPGETVEVVATAWPGGQPMAVRVAAGVFALRRREAMAVSVRAVPDTVPVIP